MRKPVVLLGLVLALAACSTENKTNPARSAMEELLISTAADRAADKLEPFLPPEGKVFVDDSHFEGTDSKYAVAAIRDVILKRGLTLAGDKKFADLIIEIRAGALSTDQNSFLIGIPQFSLPVPLSTGSLTFPEIALYKADHQTGVAKFGMTAYNAKSGKLAASPDGQFGFAHNDENTIAIFYSWRQNDVLPGGDDSAMHRMESEDKAD